MSDRTPRLLLVLPDDLLAEIDDHRFANRIETRTEAIRRLIRAGLDAAKDREAKPAKRRAA